MLSVCFKFQLKQIIIITTLLCRALITKKAFFKATKMFHLMMRCIWHFGSMIDSENSSNLSSMVLCKGSLQKNMENILPKTVSDREKCAKNVKIK